MIILFIVVTNRKSKGVQGRICHNRSIVIEKDGGGVFDLCSHFLFAVSGGMCFRHPEDAATGMESGSLSGQGVVKG